MVKQLGTMHSEAVTDYELMWSDPEEDRARLEAFLNCSTQLGYRSESAPTLASICAKADKLFRNVLSSELHLLHLLLRS